MQEQAAANPQAVGSRPQTPLSSPPQASRSGTANNNDIRTRRNQLMQ